MRESKTHKEISTLPLSVDGEAMHRQRRWKHRKIGCCCGSTVAIVILIVLVFVILAVTVFKKRNPKITVNSVKLNQFHFRVLPLELNVSLDINVSIKNPNKASFKFGSSTTQLYYRGTNVGEALVPAGQIDADKTVKMNTTVTIDATRLISNSHLLGDFLSGVFPVSTRTRVSGRVIFLKIFKHHAVSSAYCNISISISSGSIQNEQCSYNVKL